MKFCKKCQTNKDDSEFRIVRGRLNYMCKDCEVVYRRKRYLERQMSADGEHRVNFANRFTFDADDAMLFYPEFERLYDDGYSLQEIADMENITVKRLKERMSRVGLEYGEMTKTKEFIKDFSQDWDSVTNVLKNYF